MPTLWQILTAEKKEEQPLEMKYNNPLKLKVGANMLINEPEYIGQNFTVRDITAYDRRIGQEHHKFTDYGLHGKRLKQDDVNIKIRLMPSQDNYSELGHDLLILTLFDRFEYNEDFHENVLTDESKQLNADDETYFRINDVLEHYEARVVNLADKDGDGVVEQEELTKKRIHYWDYWRETEVEGIKTVEFLFVEMNNDNGYFELYKGIMANANNLVCLGD